MREGNGMVMGIEDEDGKLYKYRQHCLHGLMNL